MPLQPLTIQVEATTYDFDQKLVDFVKQIKTALSNGWNPGTTLPVILQASLADLIPAIEEVGQLSGDASDNLQAFMRSHLNSALDLASALGIVK